MLAMDGSMGSCKSRAPKTIRHELIVARGKLSRLGYQDCDAANALRREIKALETELARDWAPKAWSGDKRSRTRGKRAGSGIR